MTLALDQALTINLPIRHPKQATIASCPAKRQVICAGRRGGKTTLAADVAIEMLLAGRRVLYAAPIAEQTDAFWGKCKDWLAEPIQHGIILKWESPKRLLLLPQTGGTIVCKTAFNKDMMRGDFADFLFLDEFPLMEFEVWDEVCSPMLADNDGDAWFIGTPKRRNHFYHLFMRARREHPRWHEWHFSTFDNPHLSQEALAEIQSDMTVDSYRQEILAEFLESEGAVFRNVPACLHAPLDARPNQHVGHTIFVGCDWGKQDDYSAWSYFCADCSCEVELYMLRHRPYTYQVRKLADLCEKWQASTLVPERSAMGEPIIDHLREHPRFDRMMLLPVSMTVKSKAQIIESLVMAFEREEAQWLPFQIARDELEAYEVKYSRLGTPSYSAPSGLHDDTVVARALAWYGAKTYGRVEDWIVKPR